MKNYFKVTFKYSETTFCSNLAIAENIADVKSHYSKYDIIDISEANTSDIKEAQEKSKPIIECKHIEENTEELKDQILGCIKDMEDCDIVSLWNDFCYEANRVDDEILTMYDIIEYFRNDELENTLNRFYFGSDEGIENTSANPNRNYFQFNGYGNIVSFDYIYNQFSDEFYYIYIDELVNYIVENNDYLNNCDIQEILDNYNDNL